MHFNNVGLLATAFLASTATALPRIPHHGAVAAAGGTSGPSQEGGNLMQRSEEKTASQDNADFLLDTVGGQLGRRAEQKTASKDNADFLLNLGDETDSDYESDYGYTGRRRRRRHHVVSTRETGNSLMQRSEQKTASKDNADFLVNLGDETDSDDEGDDGSTGRRHHVVSTRDTGNSLMQRSEQKTASQDNADFLVNFGGETDSEDEGDDGFILHRSRVSNRDNGDGLIQRSEQKTASKDNADFLLSSGGVL
ncbi:uncharacterized protein BO88DRAFT_488933 [Aspergillus vadensis CBS 113365]|uniref:Uncharacterized protein n=1 Tax=Aspergillus vadensis (strain CBS 113365 / IMI 142717 / IBT 24658) TaxID=1448311 RepID=A0A319BBG3_ASPVC|nr:hypothetical protein BO88DRAFT_488933 [Aspergillus vadensis CBS 113365]PYH67940.1 hypothetical protein BO88DRAFT_488933 [Aspergillus vadensis CBS 113365]